MPDPRLLEAYLRMSPEEAKRRQSEQLRDWFEKQQELRQARLGESLGIGDAALFAKPAQVAGGWLADLLGRTRVTHKTRDNEKEQGEAAFPVFADAPSGRLRRVAERAATKGKQLPFFNYDEGLMAPRRQLEFERQIREWIPMGSSKDPGKVQQDFDDWIQKLGPDWGRKPISREYITGSLPPSLSDPFQQIAKTQGYGGIRYGQRFAAPESKAAPWEEGRLVKVKRPEHKEVTWEELKKWEQAGGIPKGWAAANPGKKPKWVRRPGEQLPEGIEDFLEEVKKARAAGAGVSTFPPETRKLVRLNLDWDPVTGEYNPHLQFNKGIGSDWSALDDGIGEVEAILGRSPFDKDIGRLRREYSSSLVGPQTPPFMQSPPREIPSSLSPEDIRKAKERAAQPTDYADLLRRLQAYLQSPER